MIILKGKYGEAKVFTELVEPEACSQVVNLLNQPYAAGAHVRLMPDIHAGAGCTIGTTMYITNKVCPNLVGVDIGCGMEVIRLIETEIDLPQLDDVIRACVPSGFDVREEPHPFAKNAGIENLACSGSVDIDRAMKSIGTLGGGNHFIEVDRDETGTLYLVVHTGSRHLGVEVAGYYQDLAWRTLCTPSEAEIKKTVEKLKAEGRKAEIQGALQAMKEKKSAVQKELAYVQGRNLNAYLNDMRLTQAFAALNRRAITQEILTQTGLHEASRFTTIHNYIDMDSGILRKGAVSAKSGERLIIPINMRDGSLICVGKGNPEWNYSAPHGAGRLCSRAKAKQMFTVEEFEAEMEGVYSTSVGQSTLDESPMAYKPIESILSNIGDTVDVVGVIKPIYNFKAS